MKHQDFSHPRTPAGYLRLFLTGFAMGAADIVPGVSGGTIAFISGIYETLINAIKSFDLSVIRMALRLQIKEIFAHVPFAFLITLGLGILAAIFALSNLLGSALETHPTLVFAFFGGLVLASIVAIGLKIKWSPATLIALVASAVIAFILVGLNPMQSADHSPLILFFSGMIAIMAMILPGISGSFILLILGQYEHILNSVRSLNIVSLVSVALGCLIGIVVFARVLSWLLKNYYNVTVAALVGFMIGSLRKIWDEAAAGTTQMAEFGATEIIIALVLLVIGFIVVSLIDHAQSRDNPVISLFSRRPAPNADAA